MTERSASDPSQPLGTGATARLNAALTDRYRIERELGAGGMATVYLAEDLKHDRKVAIKVLRPELAAVIGAERFLAEIKTTANLQHPHILGLIDSGNSDGMLWYAMPFVDGESLRDRLQREKQLPIDVSLGIACDVASALQYAHGHGVIHRDIKPENILLQDCHALVADFGIALATANASSTRMTEAGMSLGTPQYMSPEQAMGGDDVDSRADLYALGCVVYEMLAGEPPYSGPTAQAIIARMMTTDPADLTKLRRTVPSHVGDAVRQALQRLPADRFGSAAAFAAALASGKPTAQQTTGRRQTVSRLRSGRIVAGALLLAAIIGASYAASRLLERSPAPPMAFGQTTQVTSDAGLEIHPAISPDGRSVAYAGGTSARTRVYVRAVAGGRPLLLADDSAEIQTNPSWSPDGSRILFLARGTVFSAPASGGAARQELPNRPGAVGWASWSSNGGALGYVIADSLFVRTDDGITRRIAVVHEPTLCAWSHDGERIACATGNQYYATVGRLFGNISAGRIVVCRARDGTITSVSDSIHLNQSPVWSPDGRWLYFVSNRQGPRDLYGQHLTQGGEVDGPAVRLTINLGAHSISLSPDGRHLAYSVMRATANVWAMPIPAGVAVNPARAVQVTTGDQVVEGVWASRDGKWLVYDSDLKGNSDIFRIRLPVGEPEQLTTDPTDEYGAQLSPDGREIVFHSVRSGSREIFVKPLDGGPVQTVSSSPGQKIRPAWSPDGSTIAYGQLTDQNRHVLLWLVSRNADGTWGKPAQRRTDGFAPAWSPDGRLLAYATALSMGRVEVTSPDSGRPRILIDGTRKGSPSAESVAWDSSGRTIYFKSHDAEGRGTIWSIPADGGTPRLRVLFDDPARPSVRLDLAVGGNRFFFVIQDRQSDIWVAEVSKP